MFSRRVWPFKKAQTPPESLHAENVPPTAFAAGDPVHEPLRGGGGWRTRPMTQVEADSLNNRLDEDEHALEALAGVDDRLRGWPLVLSWIALLIGSWIIVLAFGYGLYTLLTWLFGGSL